jgi:hypothetical protein
MPKFREPESYYHHVLVQLAGESWRMNHDLRDGGFNLSLQERPGDTKELDYAWYQANVGIEQDGDRTKILREFTLDELRVAIPTVAKLFGMTVPKAGRLVLSNHGQPNWVGPLQKANEWSSERFSDVLGLSIGEREIDLRPHGVSQEREVVETTMPVVALGERGYAATPFMPAMLALMKWGDVVEDLVKARRTSPGYGWRYLVHFRADGKTILGEWREHDRGY